MCRSQDEDIGALNLLLGFTVLFLFSNALAAILLKTINPEMFSFIAKNNQLVIEFYALFKKYKAKHTA